MKKILFLFILIVSSNLAFSQKDSTYKKIETRLKLLEEYKSTIDKYSSAEVKEIKNQQRTFEIEYTNKKWWIDRLFAFLVGCFIVGFGGWVFLGKMANRIFKDKIEKLYEQKSNELNRIIDESSDESKIKREKKILILCKNKSSEVSDLLEFQGFKKLTILSVAFTSPEVVTELEKFDLVVIDGNDYVLDSIKINLLEIMKNIVSQERMVFFYGNNIPELFKPENKFIKDMMSSSNFKTQVVGNLINMLKYN